MKEKWERKVCFCVCDKDKILPRMFPKLFTKASVLMKIMSPDPGPFVSWDRALNLRLHKQIILSRERNHAAAGCHMLSRFPPSIFPPSTFLLTVIYGMFVQTGTHSGTPR